MSGDQEQFSFDTATDSAAPQTRPVKNTGPTDVAPPVDFAPLPSDSVYVVDAHSLIFQVFHAIPEMTSPRGEPISAVFGFTRDMLYLLEEKKPDFLLCAFDRPGPTFRHEMYEQYKADRGEMPDELATQLPLIEQVLGALGIPVIGVTSYEADDILATVARLCNAQQTNCFVVSNDKDCRQLITDHVKIYNVRKDIVYDRAELREDWAIDPEQVVDFQALVGDKVDNVPGVPLIGEKIAGQLLQQFGSLEQVLDNADEVTGAKRKHNLKEHRDAAILSRELVRLVDDVPVTVDWSAARTGKIDTESALELFTRFGFRSLSDKLKSLTGTLAPRADWQADYKTVATDKKLDALVKQLGQQKLVSVDLETTHILPRWAEPVGFSLAFKLGEAYYIPVQAPADQPQLDPQRVLDALKPILENPNIKKVGQNLKYDMIVLRNCGVQLAGVAFDTMVASYVLEAGARNHNLDELSRRYLDHETIKISVLIGSGKDQKRMDEVPVDQITEYAAEDADIPLRLMPILQKQLDDEQLDQLFRELEIPLIDALVEMEFNGITIDTKLLEKLSHQYGKRIKELEAEIYTLAGHEFNIASPKQLATVLFEEQGLPVVKKTKTGASTDADVLEQLAHDHPLPAKIIEYRQFAKLKNTYVDALPQLVHPRTGRVHASFNQVVAATGRLSSSDPNLQNIPIRSDRGREIRSAFKPGQKSWKLLAADYSQIELRVLAHYCGDKNLRDAFLRDEDIHAQVAREIYDVGADQVTPDMRRSAKAVNFGVIYGQSAFGLSKSLDIEQAEAAEFIDAYFARYPSIDQFLSEILAQCRRQGYVTTILGRRRLIDGVRADAPARHRNLAERTAINTVIQGSAADLIKRAMINIYNRMLLEPVESRLLLQIHDELVFEVPPGEVDTMSSMVREEMSGAARLTVPLKVDVKLGTNWAEVEEV